MLLALLLLAVPPSPVARALDAKLPVGKRVAALEELHRHPESLDALRPLGTTDDAALMAGYLKFLGSIPSPDSTEVAQDIYARTLDPKLKVLAVAAVQPTADTLPFFHAVLITELPPETDALHETALKKVTELGGQAALREVLRYEARGEVTLAAQLDALYALRALEPPRVTAFAKQHAASPSVTVASKAKRLLDALKRRP